MARNRYLRSILAGGVLAAGMLAALACGPAAGPAEPNPAATPMAAATAAPAIAASAATPAAARPMAAATNTAAAAATAAGSPTAAAPAATAAATAAAGGAAAPAAAPTRAAANPPATAIPTPPLAGDWQQELRAAGLYPGEWQTDFSKRSVPYAEIFSGGVPRDGIPPLDNPNFVSVAAADPWLEAQEPVIAFELNGAAKAYPLQILTWHEIVNDTVGGVPVVATFCPLCNSAIVFERTLGGVVYDFGVSGKLRNSDLIMWDRQTESWWQQLTGAAIVGELTGQQLPLLPSSLVAWQDFKAAYPEGAVLSRETGHRRSYGSNPYVGYDRVDQPPFLFFGREDDRLLPMERVAALTVGDAAAAFPFALLEREGVVHSSVGGRDLAVFFQPGARSALDGPAIAESKAVGATGVFDRDLAGQRLTFRQEGEGFVDAETGSRWNILGQAIGGPLTGQRLTPIVHANHFWFAWAAFRPDTEVVGGGG